MSTMQRLTLIGMHEWDPTLFDGLSLPEAYDKNTFIDSLMLEHGEKCVLYSNLDFMKYAIGAWGRKWSMELTRIAEALQAEYNPIWNYDRYEDWTDKSGKRGEAESNATSNTSNSSEANSGSRAASETNTKTETDSQSHEGHKLKNVQDATDKQTNDYDVTVTNENVTKGETEHLVSADDSSTYAPSSKDITDVGKQKSTTENDGDITTEHTGTKDDISEVTNNQTEGEESANSKTVNSAIDNSKVVGTASGSDNVKATNSEVTNADHVGHLWGNIGVTTSASMVTEVVQQRMKYNLYEVACRLFANELLIGIY